MKKDKKDEQSAELTGPFTEHLYKSGWHLEEGHEPEKNFPAVHIEDQFLRPLTADADTGHDFGEDWLSFAEEEGDEPDSANVSWLDENVNSPVDWDDEDPEQED